MKRKSALFLMILTLAGLAWSQSQSPRALTEKIRAKLDQVKSYVAEGRMVTKVDFMKVPDAQVKIYFKQPDKIRIRNEKGISLIPRGTMVFSMSNMLEGNFTAIEAGYDTLDGQPLRMIKILPLDEKSTWVISTLYIDEKQLLIRKANTTTRENGTYELLMSYGRYAPYALPDRLVCRFNTRNYKLPKGVTFDYDDGSHKENTAAKGETRGMVEINYSSYQINQPVPDNLFKAEN